MDNYLLLARSITHAQQMMKVLDRYGIRSRVQRAGAGLTERGCGYTLEISARDYPAAMQRLREGNLKPVKVFFQSGGTRQEVEA